MTAANADNGIMVDLPVMLVSQSEISNNSLKPASILQQQ